MNPNSEIAYFKQFTNPDKIEQDKVVLEKLDKVYDDMPADERRQIPLALQLEMNKFRMEKNGKQKAAAPPPPPPPRKPTAPA